MICIRSPFSTSTSDRSFSRKSQNYTIHGGRQVARQALASAQGTNRKSELMEYLGKFDFDTYSKERAVIVQKALEKAVPSQYPEDLFEPMRYSLLAPGKRVRPNLALASCELVGGTIDQAMPLACSVEMIHTMSLIHDDLPSMDNDDFRRGQPTNHIKYGEDMAILAGDALLSYSYEHVARETKGVPPERVIQVICEMGTAMMNLTKGQVVDIKSEGMGDKCDLNTLQYIHKHKTAALIEVSVVGGAILGGANDDDVAKLRKYSENIGLAFQVVDDVLDVTQTTEQLGKTAGKDMAVDKSTYPSLLGIEKSKQVANDLIQEALDQLEDYDKEKAAPLAALAMFILNRQS